MTGLVRSFIGIILLFGGVLVVLILGWQASITSDIMTVAFLDVGQGDAIFIEAPTGEQMLIDAGPDRSVLARLSEVMPWLDRSIDVVLATHPDRDHIGGFPSVLGAYRVDHVITSGQTGDTAMFDALVRSVLDEQAQVELVRRGSVVQLGDVRVEVLFPELVLDLGDANASSIVVLVQYGEVQFLLTGDVGVEAERYLVAEYGDYLDSEVLKLGHHGSDTSTSDELLRAVMPGVAIVSAGRDNSYGHPDEAVVERVQSYGIPILTTQSGQSIVFETDGRTVWQP